MTKRGGFSDRLIEAMDERGVTASDLARLSGLHKATISRLREHSRPPRAETVAKLASALGVTTEWLTYGHGPMRRASGTHSAVSIPDLLAEPPVGPRALEAVLATYEWPRGVDVSLLENVERMAREEAKKPSTATRSVSLWKAFLDAQTEKLSAVSRMRPTQAL